MRAARFFRLLLLTSAFAGCSGPGSGVLIRHNACSLARNADFVGRFSIVSATRDDAVLELLEPLISTPPNQNQVPAPALRQLQSATPPFRVTLAIGTDTSAPPGREAIAFIVWSDRFFRFAEFNSQGLFVRRDDGRFSNSMESFDGIDEAKLLAEARHGSTLFRGGSVGCEAVETASDGG